MASRTTTTARKAKTVVEPITPVQPVTADVSPPDEATLLERVRSSVHDWTASIHAPSWMRLVASTLIGLATTSAVWWSGMQLVEMIMLATIGYTGVGFIAFTIAFIGVLLTLVSAVTAGSKVFDFCMSFEYSRVKARALGWFTPKPLLKTEPVA